MLPARLLSTSSVLAAQALLGFGIGYFLGGPVPAGVIACVAVIASLALRSAAHHPYESAFRQFVLAAALTALHMAALYTIGDDGTTPLLGANAQLVLAGFGLAACAWFAARKRTQLAMIPPLESRSALIEDQDSTIEIESLSDERAGPEPLETIASPRLRNPLALGVLSSALLVFALMFWLGDDGARDSMSGAVARELPASDARAAVSAESTASVEVAPPVAVTTPEAVEATEPATTASANGSAVVRDNAVAPSAARRECMAQIESARLFLQLARQSDDAAQYSSATELQIARMLNHRPVGPRTLGRIAERMWEQRASPERNASWWSTQFARCEAARSGGSWYVVRG